MILYRLSREKYTKDLSGKGAEIVGGRWNSKGIAILYTGQNRALCTTELAVHIPFGIVPVDYCMVTIEIPENSTIEIVDIDDLPKEWREFPHNQLTKIIGDNFIQRNESIALKVPSAVVQGEYNYLINPRHIDFDKVKIIKIEKFNFDQRLFKR